MRFLIPFFLMFLSAAAQETYFEQAGKLYNIDPRILWAIAKHESRLNPEAKNINSNGTVDIGIMQINTIHLKELKKYNIGIKELYDPKTNIFVGAWVLSNCIKRYGSNRNALTCYNGRIKGNNYAFKVIKQLNKAEQR